MFLTSSTSPAATSIFGTTSRRTSGPLPGRSVGKDTPLYQNECRHGLGYTRMTAEYGGVFSEALYYVPLGKSYEVWSLKVTNHTDLQKN